jgi:RNA polymerase sigma-70 factor (ECF subfamily)
MLCLEHHLAETLVKKAFARAWRTQRHPANGSGLTIWVFRIFHEEFRSHSRQNAGKGLRYRGICWNEFAGERGEEPVSGLTAGIVKGLAALSDSQREALILISAAGFACEDVAEICGTQPRTAKSRAVRARTTLMKILESDEAFGNSDAIEEQAGGWTA